MQVTIHGIKNCDSVKKARKWLDSHDVEYLFRDFRAAAPTAEEIHGWLAHCDWQQLLNKRSTTWKSLAESERATADDVDGAVALLASHPTLIKRPVLTTANDVRVGFDADEYQAIFNQ